MSENSTVWCQKVHATPNSKPDLYFNYLKHQQSNQLLHLNHTQHDKETCEKNQQQQQLLVNSKKIFFSSLPFIVLVLAKVASENLTGILTLLFLQATFTHCNKAMKRFLISPKLQEKKRRMDLTFLLIILTCNIVLLFIIHAQYHLYRSFYLLPVSLELKSCCLLLWVLLMNDFIVIFVTILIKIILSFCITQIIPLNKGQWCQLIENCSQLYRRVVPITPWVCFLLNDGVSWLSVILFVFFVIIKSLDLYTNVLKLKRILSFPTQERYTRSRQEVEGLCIMCHEIFKVPVTLHCGHTFCEECVNEWLDREACCGICADKVHDHIEGRDGNTCGMPQLF